MLSSKLGFYQSGKNVSVSRREVTERTLSIPHWNFNDDVFSVVNWNKEPPETLSDLYIARCRQLREKYDYVVLMFSGGSDSDNMLEHWLLSGCKLDEVVILNRQSGANDKTSFSEIEQNVVAIPKAMMLQQLHKFKLTIFDQSTAMIDFIKQTDDIPYVSNIIITPNVGSRRFLFEQPHIKRVLSQGKKVVLVWGADKIIHSFRKQKLSVSFDQHNVECCVGPLLIANSGEKEGKCHELFYWTADFPDVVIKQAHVIKQYLSCPINHVTNPQFVSYGQQSIKLTDDGYRRVVYPFWDLKTFTAGKSSSTTISNRDQWLWRGNLPEARRFEDIVKQYHTNVTTTKNTYTVGS